MQVSFGNINDLVKDYLPQFVADESNTLDTELRGKILV